MRRESAVAPCVLALAAGACQQYEAAPLDLPGHRAVFADRTPESGGVRALADQLRAGAGATTGFDLLDGVTCEEAEAVAVVLNADLRLARLRAGVSAASAANAGLWEDPAIGVDLARIIEGVPSPWKAFGMIELTVPVSGRLEVEKRQASASHRAELARVALAEWRVRMDVRRAYADWGALRAQAEATEEFLRRTEPMMALVDRLERAGEMPRTEARLFRIERAATESDGAVLGTQAAEAGLRLCGLMGLSPDSAVRLAAFGPSPGAELGVSDAWVEERNPAVAVAAAEYQAAEHQLELEVARQVGDLGLSPGFGSDQGDEEVTLGLRLPLPVVNANRRAIAEATARRELARAEAETTLERQIAMLRSAQTRLDGARRRRESLEAGLAPLVDAQSDDARRLAELGEVNTLVMIETLTRQRDVKLRLIESFRAEQLARIDVQEALGPEPARTYGGVEGGSK